jgi:hypothetical protein
LSEPLFLQETSDNAIRKIRFFMVNRSVRVKV